MVEYSYLDLYFSRDTSREDARKVLTDHAEYVDSELSRLRRYPDGRRHVRLRRKIIRVVRTM